MSSLVAKDPPISCETLVVGAGIVGLFAAALKLKQGKKVLLVEASNRIGGRCSPELRDGFQLGAGLAFSGFSILEELAGKLDLPLDKISLENNASLVHSGKSWIATA